MTPTDYDTWLFSNDGNEPISCPHCNTNLDYCRCDDEDDDLQQELTKLDSQIDASKKWMRGVNESKNEMR